MAPNARPRIQFFFRVSPPINEGKKRFWLASPGRMGLAGWVGKSGKGRSGRDGGRGLQVDPRRLLRDGNYF